MEGRWRGDAGGSDEDGWAREMDKGVNKPKLTADNVERALRFLKGRKAHQHRLKNEAWEKEYENIIVLLERLTGRR